MTSASVLEQRFHRAMLDIYLRAKKEAGYNASVFYRMVDERGGLSTARFLINSPRASDGYTALYERERLDLTVEAMVIENPEWAPLFADEELERARKRLNDYGYHARRPE